MPPAKRPHCPRCLRPQRTCICCWIRPIEHGTEVLFLQHPLEAGHAKNSAHLLHLSLPHSRLVVGEQFDEAALRALLYEPFSPEHEERPVRPLLLYPGDPDETARLPSEQDQAAPVRHRLVVLDATWRKSRKMLHLNPLLQQLPRLALHRPPASRYAIRKAHRPEQLSSYEAVCHALIQLEEDAEQIRPLLTAFDGFVAQQRAYAENGARPDDID